MKYRLVPVCLSILVLASSAPVVARILGSQFTMVEDGKPRAVIVLGEKRTSVEKYAGEELAKYVKSMSGTRLPIVSASNRPAYRNRNAILIGRPETHHVIRSLCGSKLLNLSARAPGLDGFVIRTIRDRSLSANYLVVGGSVDRGTLYGVYHLLENVFHVGFFEDGEYVPKLRIVRVGTLNISERPAFEMRQYMGPQTNYYTSSSWLFPEWKYECDYAAKKKQNLLNVDVVHSVRIYLKRKVEASYGVKDGSFPESSGPANERADLHDVKLVAALHKYVRSSLGLEALGPSGGADGMVSAAFRAANPQIRYLETSGLTASGGVAPTLYIDPRTDEFRDYAERYLRLHNELLGAGKYYLTFAIGGEGVQITTDPDLDKTVRADYAGGILSALRKVDPKGVVFVPGWSFMYAPWPTHYVKQFCDVFPVDSFVTSDMWAEAMPLRKLHNHFFGKKWLLGTVGVFGSDNTLCGDMAKAISMHKNVLNEPNAEHCVGTTIQAESFGWNPLYWDLLLNATWDPRQLTIEKHISDYSVRRYGSRSANRLSKAMRLLYESVYGEPTYIHKFYHPRPLYRQDNLTDLEPVRAAYLKRSAYIPKLREALRIMLSESANQKGNKLYDNDVVDVCRQYVAELINQHTISLYDAFKAGDSDGFDACALAIENCFDNLTLILSSNSRYYLETEIRQWMARDIASGRAMPQDGLLYARTAAGRRLLAHPDLYEYCSQDKLELVKYYYRPKMRAYIDVLRGKLKSGDRSISAPDVLDGYRQVAQEYWGNDDCNLKPGDIFNGTVARAAAQVLANLASVPQPQ